MHVQAVVLAHFIVMSIETHITRSDWSHVPVVHRDTCAISSVSHVDHVTITCTDSNRSFRMPNMCRTRTKLTSSVSWSYHFFFCMTAEPSFAGDNARMPRIIARSRDLPTRLNFWHSIYVTRLHIHDHAVMHNSESQWWALLRGHSVARS